VRRVTDGYRVLVIARIEGDAVATGTVSLHAYHYSCGFDLM